MAVITPDQAGGKNRAAFLDMVAISEIGKQILANSDDGYNVLVGSTPSKIMTFPSYATHPNIYNKQTNSTAAGRYQILYRYWPHYKMLLSLPDFGPLSQDKYALQQIKEQRALPLIDSGNFVAAVRACNNIWASLTGSTYGQNTHDIDYLTQAYTDAGGTLA